MVAIDLPFGPPAAARILPAAVAAATVAAPIKNCRRCTLPPCLPSDPRVAFTLGRYRTLDAYSRAASFISATLTPRAIRPGLGEDMSTPVHPLILAAASLFTGA